MFRILSSFSLWFKVAVASGSTECQTPKALTLCFGHLKFLPGSDISSLLQFAPIQRASVFLSLSFSLTGVGRLGFGSDRGGAGWCTGGTRITFGARM